MYAKHFHSRGNSLISFMSVDGIQIRVVRRGNHHSVALRTPYRFTVPPPSLNGTAAHYRARFKTRGVRTRYRPTGRRLHS